MNNTKNQNIFRSHASSFYFASFWLEKEDFESISSLYALCRQVDDIADENISNTASFRQLSNVIKNVRSKNIEDACVEKLTSISPSVDPDIFIHLLLGVRSDTQTVKIADENELLKYCYRVAGTVGLMMCNVLRVEDPRALNHAIDLGIAMQLTNIARDVIDDANMGRRYLPGTWIENCKCEEILIPSNQQVIIIKKAVKRLLTLAEEYYDSGFNGLPFLSLRVRFVVLIAGRVYKRIGSKIQNSNFNIWGGRIYTTRIEKLLELIVSVLAFFASPSFYTYKTKHKKCLHKALEGCPGANIAK